MALTQAPARLDAAVERRGAPPLTSLLLLVPVLLACGAFSVWLGQDATWDLRNYHLYGPWAYLSDRKVDWAAAQMQSFFNPWLDVPYYWLSQRMTAPAVAFVMGAWHGLVAWPLYAVARRFAPPLTALLCTAGGMLQPIFLYQFGSTMGDAAGALLVLFAVWAACCVLPVVGQSGPRPVWGLAAAACLGGAVTGLKLTHGPMMLGLCLMPLAAAAPWPVRCRAVLVALLAGAIGVAVTAGYWFWTMWADYGNPLFPQFNNLFRSELAASAGVVDDRWGPRTALQTALWPVFVLLRPYLFGEISMVPVLLVVLYGVAGALLLRAGWRCVRTLIGIRTVRLVPADHCADAMLVFAAVAYLSWLEVFGIGRYLVSLELLAPLLLLLALNRLRARSSEVQEQTISKTWLVALLFATSVSLLNLKTWGKADFAEQAYRVEVPSFDWPKDTAVLLIGSEPQAWMTPHFSPEVAFASVGGNFPESDASRSRLGALLEARRQWFAVIPADKRAAVGKAVITPRLLDPIMSVVQGVAWMGTTERCGVVARLSGLLFYRPRSVGLIEGGGHRRCAVIRMPENAVLPEDLPSSAAVSLLRYGLRLAPADCALYDASIGRLHLPYRVCPVRPIAAAISNSPGPYR